MKVKSKKIIRDMEIGQTEWLPYQERGTIRNNVSLLNKEFELKSENGNIEYLKLWKSKAYEDIGLVRVVRLL